MEVKTVDSFSWGQKYWFKCEVVSYIHKNLIEVDYSCFVAHLRRLMVVAPDCRESHLGVGGAHWDAERRGRSLPVRGRVWVADHEAFALQDDRLRVILSSHNLSDHSPAEHQYEGVHHGSLWQLWLRRYEKRETVSCTTQVSESLHWSPPPQTRLTLWNSLNVSRDVPYPSETSTK